MGFQITMAMDSGLFCSKQCWIEERWEKKMKWKVNLHTIFDTYLEMYNCDDYDKHIQQGFHLIKEKKSRWRSKRLDWQRQRNIVLNGNESLK